MDIGNCIDDFIFQTIFEWNIYFVLLGCGMIYAMVIFFFFGSGELQPWARPPSKPTRENKDINMKLII